MCESIVLETPLCPTVPGVSAPAGFDRHACLSFCAEIVLVFPERFGRVLGRADVIEPLVSAALRVLLFGEQVARPDRERVVGLAIILGSGQERVSLKCVGEDELGVAVVELALKFGDGLVSRLADVPGPMFLHVDQANDGHPAKVVGHAFDDLAAVVIQQDRLVAAPESPPHVIHSPTLAGIARPVGVDHVAALVVIRPLGRVDVFADQAFEVPPRRIGAPPDHVGRQDIRRDDLVEPEP